MIDPEECIDCTLCVAECPARAIMLADDVPEAMQHFIELNAELSKIWPVIVEKQEPPPDAERWNGMPNKLEFLER